MEEIEVDHPEHKQLIPDIDKLPLSEVVNPLVKKYSYKNVGSNGVITVEPEVLNFAGFYELNKTYTMKAKIINSSNVPQRVNILPPMTPYFTVKYSKKGMIPTNSAEEIYVQFNPTEYKYYYDCVRIHGAGIILPIHAYPVINRTQERLLPKLINMREVTGTDNTYTKKVYIECDTPVTFEYVIEWDEKHSDIYVSPMSGEIKPMGKTPLEITYRPNSNTTAQATFKMTTTEFNSKPCYVRVVGASKPGDGPQRADVSYYNMEDNEDEEYSRYGDSRTKTLLGSKPSKYTKRPGSGVKLKQIDSTQLSTTRKGQESTRKLQETTRYGEDTQPVDGFPTLKTKLTSIETSFIQKYRQLEELDKVKEIKFFE
jgi:hypothetical protein